MNHPPIDAGMPCCSGHGVINCIGRAMTEGNFALARALLDAMEKHAKPDEGTPADFFARFRQNVDRIETVYRSMAPS